MKRILRFLLLLSLFPGSILAQSTSSSISASHKKDAKGNDELTFTVLFSNAGTSPVTTVEVALSMPPGLADQVVQVVEKSIGSVPMMVESRSTSDARILKFKAKNVNLGRYNPNDPNTQGKVVIKTNLPLSKLGEVKATVKFDGSDPEEIQNMDVYTADH